MCYELRRTLSTQSSRRMIYGRTSASLKLHSWVTTLGQQGTEVQDGKSSTLGCMSRAITRRGARRLSRGTLLRPRAPAPPRLHGGALVFVVYIDEYSEQRVASYRCSRCAASPR